MTKSEKIWLSSPHMGGNERAFVNEAFDTNWIAPLGPHVTDFENDLEKYLGQNSHVAGLSSGTSALHMALILLGIKPDDVVICQSMTFSASANPILYQGATPVFIDSEEQTWNLCPKALEEAIIHYINLGKSPKAIIAVHLYGMPFKVEEINAVAKKYNIPIIEDSAEALGSSYKGQKCGTFGTLNVLSFNGNKIITTSGGGAIVCKDQATKEKAVFFATQSRENAPHYQHKEIGYNYRLSNVCAGIGRGQMEVLDNHVKLRQANHQFYVDIFKESSTIKVFTEPNDDFRSNHWLSCILTDSYEKREKIRLALESENIESRPLWKPMHLQPVFEKYAYFGSKISENLFEKGLCLPSGSNLSSDDKERINFVLKSFVN
jgi:dTDP-4-amino-4,6-dideoxygalactose transaminase